LNVGVCERTGIKFELVHGSVRHPYGPSVDRIDANGFYSDENVQIVCWAYNVGKAEMTDEKYHEYLLKAAGFINGRA